MKSSPIPIRTTRQTNSTHFNFAAVPNDREIQQLMDRVVNGEKAAETTLAELLRPGVAFFLRYSLGEGKPLKGAVEDVLGLAMLGVQSQKLRNAPELVAFAVQTARHRLHAPSKAVTKEARSQVAAMSKALARMSTIQRKAISAYYLEHKTPEQMPLEFGIEADEFRNLVASIRLQHKDSQSEVEELDQMREQRQQLTRVVADLKRENRRLKQNLAKKVGTRVAATSGSAHG